MAVKRNEPCPCGSGKKHKHCCGRAQRPDLTVLAGAPKRTSGKPVDPDRARSLMNKANRTLHEFGLDRFGYDEIEEAMEDAGELVQRDQARVWGLPEDDAMIQLLLLPWLVALWRPDGSLSPREHVGAPSPNTIAAEWLAAAERHPRMSAMVETLRREPLSFWEVVELDPGRGIVLRDLIVDREHFVHDRNLSRTVVRWSIIFAQVVEIEGARILGASAPLSSPPQIKAVIEAFGAKLKEAQVHDPVDLLQFDLGLLGLLGEILTPPSTPPFAGLRTTDGQELIQVESRFEFDPADREGIIATLRAQPELEAEDEGAEGHRIIDDEPSATLGFVWVIERPDDVLMPNVLQAQIEVGKHSIVTSTVSRERDEAIRERLEVWLGEQIEFGDSHEEDVMEAVMERFASGGMLSRSGQRQVIEPPAEAVEIMRSRLRKHVEQWADERIPALDDQTPREACAMPEGRARVDALLREWEHSDASTQSGISVGAEAFESLRRDLGLEP